ncbi:AP endonuclease [Mycolicibacterium wolinskyi]|uniref:AP endonuclease n=1 Tax=Mycolicibacterium wolinskyi TaxID=59750 RepID=A0A132PRR3_9MYCO|nr:TIM barrel protein [Mycolicibacterium wolinskyi]KWX24985.1 AP endonuclease [Mycolicibacterium wolinskyi]
MSVELVAARARLGLAPLTVLELSPPDMVSCAAAAGYHAVGLRLIRATADEPQRPTIGMTPLIRQTRERLDDTGIELRDIEVLRLTPTTRVRDDFEAFLETGAYLGAGEILVAGNDPDMSRAAANLAELAELADGYGLTPNIEPMPYNDVRDVTEAASLIERAGHRNIGLLIDPIHYYRGHNVLADLAALPASWFRYLQLCDAPTELPSSTEALVYQSRVARLLPGSGGLDLLALLLAIPPHTPVSVEAPVVAPGVPAVERAKAALHSTCRVLELADRIRDEYVDADTPVVRAG